MFEKNVRSLYFLGCFILTLSVHAASGLCTPGRFGVNCRSSCHCGSGYDNCDRNTGVCINGQPCAAGYHGKNCQKQNVALRKPAHQSSDYSDSISGSYVTYSADFAVDGDASTNFYDNHCSHTQQSTYSWWYVDLQQKYNIRYLRVYNRHPDNDFRLQGFAVRISNSTQPTNHQLCYQHPSSTPAEVTNVRCDSTIRGRYVRIDLGFRVSILTLCEVQVFVCTAYSFGENCEKLCNCMDESEVCDAFTGSCTSGCAAGYQGENCTTECHIDYYRDCTTRCSDHCLPVTGGQRQCNLISGDCTNTARCQAGYQLPKCDQKCVTDYYGDCTARCSDHCMPVTGGQRKCNFIFGHCTYTGRCQAGYQLPKCDQKCATDYYGDCTTRCSDHCIPVNRGQRQCNFISGDCTYTDRCQAGYQLPTCDQKCLMNYYGDCRTRCSEHCMPVTKGQRKCNFISGFCTNTGGCQAGYQPPICDRECLKDYYGNCTTSCSEHCIAVDGRRCNFISGDCTDTTGCQPGYHGSRCNQECPMDSYGDFTTNCSKHCIKVENRQRQCNFISGDCTNATGCQAGYNGSKCDKECSNAMYGEGCNGKCSKQCIIVSSLERVCNHVTGACAICKPGYQGNKCDQNCTNGYYGDKCRLTCSTHCQSSHESLESTCHHVNGHCSSGCDPGYHNDMCMEVCSNGTFGEGCNGKCSEYCIIASSTEPICNHVSGACDSCRPGYNGTNCDGTCYAGTYGLNCSIICNEHCQPTENGQPICHHVTGNCTSGCRDGFIASSESICIKDSAQPDVVVSNEASVYVLPDDDGDVYCNVLPLRSLASDEGIAVSDLWDYVVEQKRTGGLKAEYKKLPVGLVHTANAALKPENKGKSRYLNIYAYDHTRIVLDVDDESTHTDYINANYVSGYKNMKTYIASQGPNAITIEDFWRMVWQKNCSKIVVLTRLVENGNMKCDQYWPDSGSKDYGNIIVKMIQVDEFADFTIRTLLIKHTQSSDKRIIKQFHFMSWPDHGVPDYATALVSFRDKVTATSSSTTGPVVIHCSAGIGRTGTYAGLDFLIEQAKAEGKVDIFGCIKVLRYYRVNMIQTAEQYEFLHDALLEALNLSALSIPSFEFMDKYVHLKNTNSRSGKSYLQEQFELLSLLSPSDNPDDFQSAQLEENINKHRDISVMAADNHRVYLTTHIADTGNYINAVYLPAYKEPKAFIITQMPLSSTVIDFWRMIYENKCRTIVMLNDDSAENDVRYWRNDGTPLRIGPFNITSQHDIEGSLHNTMPLELTHADNAEDVIKIRLFQCKFWPESEKVPPDASLIITALEDVEHWQQRSGISTTVVHCMNGAEKSGVYCTISAVIDRLKIEQQVNISQTIKQLRIRRPQIINCMEQYQFCHDAVIAYLESFQTYSNFK